MTLGILVAAWGPAWTFLGTNSPDAPFVHAAMVRIAGGVLVALGLSAVAIARSADVAALGGAIGWFALGHFLLAFVLMTQRDTIIGPGLAGRATGITMALFVGLMYVREAMGASGPAPAAAAVSAIRSRYERAIREAASQEERHRLARDLHDSIKQQIFAIQTAAATAEMRLSGDRSGVGEALSLVRSAAREAMTEMESMLDQLRAAPLDSAGLVAALRKQCEAVGFRTGAVVSFIAETIPPDSAIGPGARPAVLRVAQEALANVARHARATAVTVTLGSSGDDLTLIVADNGGGFDRGGPSTGMGLRNMQTRAADVDGRCTVTSAPGRGTIVSLTVPALAPDASLPQDRWRPWNNSVVVWTGAILVGQLWPGRTGVVAMVLACIWSFASDPLRHLLQRRAAA